MMKKNHQTINRIQKSSTFAASLVKVHCLTSERANALIYGRR